MQVKQLLVLWEEGFQREVNAKRRGLPEGGDINKLRPLWLMNIQLVLCVDDREREAIKRSKVYKKDLVLYIVVK